MADIQLTKHENQQFSDQTLHLSGHAYLDCTFERCTLLVTNTPFYLEGCTFISCNWHLNYDVLWGAEGTHSALRQLLTLMEETRDTPQA